MRYSRAVVRLAVIHAVVGVLGATGLAMILAVRPDVLGGERIEVVGPMYDPERLGIWLQERSPGRCSVRFMLGRSRVFESVDGRPVPVIPRPEAPGPEWMEDWATRIADLHAAGIMVSTDEVREHAFGWPRLCLKTSELNEIKALGGWREYTEGLATFGDFSVPVTPMVSGLAFNALLFGFPGSTAVLVFGLVRSISRRRAGCCVGCAYALDEGSLICPECGRATGTQTRTIDAPRERRAA